MDRLLAAWQPGSSARSGFPARARACVWSARKQVASPALADARGAGALAADAASLSLQVSWHLVAFPEPAPHRSLLPGAGSSPVGIIVQDLPLTPRKLGGLRFLGHRSLCLYLTACSPRQVSEAQSTGTGPDHGGLEEENHHPEQWQQPKGGFPAP